MQAASPLCRGLKVARIWLLLKTPLRRYVSNSKAVQMLAKLGGGVAFAVESSLSNHTSRRSHCGHMSGFRAILNKATQRRDNTSPWDACPAATAAAALAPWLSLTWHARRSRTFRMASACTFSIGLLLPSRALGRLPDVCRLRAGSSSDWEAGRFSPIRAGTGAGLGTLSKLSSRTLCSSHLTCKTKLCL